MWQRVFTVLSHIGLKCIPFTGHRSEWKPWCQNFVDRMCCSRMKWKSNLLENVHLWDVGVEGCNNSCREGIVVQETSPVPCCHVAVSGQQIWARVFQWTWNGNTCFFLWQAIFLCWDYPCKVPRHLTLLDWYKMLVGLVVWTDTLVSLNGQHSVNSSSLTQYCDIFPTSSLCIPAHPLLCLDFWCHAN